jgi:nucleoside-diphosphate-sugar epimerase
VSILITGASGFIGRDLVKILSKKYKILAFYRSKNYKKTKNVTWLKNDLSIKKKLKLPYSNITCIINCAIDQKYKKINFIKYKKTNINLINNLLNYTNENKVKFFLNLSSIDVYGEVNKSILTESYKPKKPNNYGKLKRHCEKKIEKRKINYINLRLPGVLCNPYLNKFKRTWLNYIFENLINEKKIKIFNINNNFNNLTTTNEIARFVVFLIQKNISTKGTYNFSCVEPIKIKDLINTSKKIINSNSKVIIEKKNKKNSFEISNTKLQKKLKFFTKPTKIILKNYLRNLIKDKYDT